MWLPESEDITLPLALDRDTFSLKAPRPWNTSARSAPGPMALAASSPSRSTKAATAELFGDAGAWGARHQRGHGQFLVCPGAAP